ncbi:MAG TPA: HEAT repeat domain-containing protein [Polyangiaceae bacterium]|nr:HEAT repeat domain-containing protein [Polyangiaceae bacterium]
MERWRKPLESSNESELLAALEELSGLGESAGAAAPMVNSLLARGANTKVLLSALNTAALLGQASSSDFVAPYVSHRNTEIRRAAARTLARTKGATAVTALRQALTGQDPVTRGLAAAGLGQLGAKEAVNELFAVLVRDTPEAAVSIASLCSPEQCDRLMDFVGKLKFQVLEASFVPLLLRPQAELPDANKIRYIDRLRRLQTKGAASVLETVSASLPKEESAAVRAALTAALRARPVVGDPSP